jgi:hypothetical protein
MDEEYVQEHILTGGIVAPVGGKKIGRPADTGPDLLRRTARTVSRRGGLLAADYGDALMLR